MTPVSAEHESDVLKVQRRGGAVWLTLNRPTKLNCINPATIKALNQAFDGLSVDDKCIVITGNGRAFCAGGDLDAVQGLSSERERTEQLARFHQSITDTLRRLEELPIPSICVVNGMAVAGGLEIAAACDIVVADESATFGDGHAVFGLLPGGGGSVRLPRKIGRNRAKFLMLTGRQVSARTMAEWGLVSVVASTEDLRQSVEEVIAELTARSALGLARMKSLIDAGLEHSLDAALTHEQALANLHAYSHDYAEGLSAFQEARTPKFSDPPW